MTDGWIAVTTTPPYCQWVEAKIGAVVFRAYYQDGEWWDSAFFRCREYPTHWRPLEGE